MLKIYMHVECFRATDYLAPSAVNAMCQCRSSRVSYGLLSRYLPVKHGLGQTAWSPSASRSASSDKNFPDSKHPANDSELIVTASEDWPSR